MKLLQITGNESIVFEALQEEAGFFGDNGGDPDGPLYLQESAAFSPNLLKTALATGECAIVNGYKADYAELPVKETMEQFFDEGWCGYGSAGEAYFLSKNDADLCQRIYGEWQKDDDIESIAHRVHAIYA